MSYKLSDNVSFRLIQIFQEAVLLGVDGADLLRQVRLVQDPEDAESLSLDPDYEKQVQDSHTKLLEDATTLAESKNQNVFS